MSSQSKSQTGVALALVLWLLAALAVTVGGLVSISREGVARSDMGHLSAKAYYLGRGIARLAMFDKATQVDKTEPDENAEQRLSVGVFTATYKAESALIRVSIHPASGYVSLSGSSEDTWRTLLTKLGGMESAAADEVIVHLLSESFGATAPVGDPSSFAFARQMLTRDSREVVHVERLLSVQGLSRDVYDRIRRSVSPFSSTPTPIMSFAPPELRVAFAGDQESQEEGSLSDGSDRYFCVEMRFEFPGSHRLEQRIWVESTEAGSGLIRLVRVERPMSVVRAQLG